MSIKVYGIPTCGTVKKARKWLDDNGHDYVFVDFRKDPPADEAVDQWVKTFGAKAMKNTSGGAYRSLGDEKKTWSDDQWAEAFKKDPMLIKRPIVEKDDEPIQVGFRIKKIDL